MTTLRWLRFMWAAARHTWPHRKNLSEVVITRIHVGSETDDFLAGCNYLAKRQNSARREVFLRNVRQQLAEYWASQSPSGPPS